MQTIRTLQANYTNLNQLDLQVILSHTLHQSKEFILAHPEYQLTILETTKLHYYLFRYRHGIPLAYITHHKEFYGLDFYINKHTLIPRPDTEILVEAALTNLTTAINPLLIDIGTGSGCIPIAIQKTIQQYNNRKIDTLATDISEPALRVAKKNAKHHGCDVQFFSGNLLEPIIFKKVLQKTTFESLVLTANLPYLTHEQFKTEISIQKEPYNALVAKERGLALYNRLLAQIGILAEQYNIKNLTAYFEIDPSQTELITAEIKKTLPHAVIEVKKDLGGRDRVVLFSLKN